jgi:hypothetical protein
MSEKPVPLAALVAVSDRSGIMVPISIDIGMLGRFELGSVPLADTAGFRANLAGLLEAAGALLKGTDTD